MSDPNPSVSEQIVGEKVEFKPHPLLIDQIMQTVAKRLDFCSLKSGRSVCQKWEQFILPEFLKTTTLHLRPTVLNLDTYANIITSVFPLDPKNVTPTGFQNIQIRSVQLLNIPTFRNWMAEYGHTFLSLTVGDSCVFDFESISLKDIETLLLDWCPALKELQLASPRLNSADAVPNLDLKPTETGKHSSLTSLSLASQTYLSLTNDAHEAGIIARYVMQLAPSLGVLAMNGGFEPKTLGIQFLLQNSIEPLTRLRTMDLHLEQLTVPNLVALSGVKFMGLQVLGLGPYQTVTTEEGPDPVAMLALRTVLENVSHSLEELILGEPMHVPIARIFIFEEMIPLMPRLTVFVIQCIRVWAFQDVNPLSLFPHLRHFDMDDGLGSLESMMSLPNWMSIKPEEPILNPELMSLGIPCCFRFIQEVKDIVRSYPNLQSLTMGLQVHPLFILQVLQELTNLHGLRRLWIKTECLWMHKREDAVRNALSNLQQLRSVVIEGTTYLFMKIERTIPGVKLGSWYPAYAFKGHLVPVLLAEFKIGEFQLRYLKAKVKETAMLPFCCMI